MGLARTRSDAVPMTTVDFIPNEDQEITLRYWCWIGQQIQLLGATNDRNVLLYYVKTLVAPTLNTDVLGINQAELFLGPRLAAICYQSLGDERKMQTCDMAANTNLGLILRAQVRQQQNLPVRKRPFSYRFRRNNRYTL